MKLRAIWRMSGVAILLGDIMGDMHMQGGESVLVA